MFEMQGFRGIYRNEDYAYNPDKRDKCLIRKISLKKQEIFL